MAEIKQNPFSFYDFLGYFFPGAFCLLLIFFCYSCSDNLSFNSFFNFLRDNFVSDGKFWSNLEDTIILIILSYILGHLLAFISSITIEPFANIQYGYPSKYLLGIKRDEYYKFKCYKKLVYCLLVIILLPFSLLIKLLNRITKIINDKNKKFSFPKSLDENLRETIINKILCLFRLLNINFTVNINKSQNQNKDYNDNKKKKFFCCLLKLFSKSKDDKTSNLGKKDESSHSEIKNEDFNKICDSDFFRIVSSYVYENDKKHAEKMDNYVTLYGFLRSLCLIFTFFTWFGIFNSFHPSWKLNGGVISLIICSILFSFFFFLGFVKFYRRYTLEGLLAIITDKNIK